MDRRKVLCVALVLVCLAATACSTSYHVNANTLACQSLDTYNRVAKLTRDPNPKLDPEEKRSEQALENALFSGQCVSLTYGEVVQIHPQATTAERIKVTPKGGSVAYWTSRKAVSP